MRHGRALVAAAVLLPATLAVSCGGGDPSSATTTTVEVTLTTEADVDPATLGDELLVRAGAREAVQQGQGAEERLVELGTSWCTTAARSDVDNADATFRYSLSGFFTEWGVVDTSGEVQDIPLGKAMLVGAHATDLAAAVNEAMCPEVQRSDG